jgi:hypothetical protein
MATTDIPVHAWSTEEPLAYLAPEVGDAGDRREPPRVGVPLLTALLIGAVGVGVAIVDVTGLYEAPATVVLPESSVAPTEAPAAIKSSGGAEPSAGGSGIGPPGAPQEPEGEGEADPESVDEQDRMAASGLRDGRTSSRSAVLVRPRAKARTLPRTAGVASTGMGLMA